MAKTTIKIGLININQVIWMKRHKLKQVIKKSGFLTMIVEETDLKGNKKCYRIL